MPAPSNNTGRSGGGRGRSSYKGGRGSNDNKLVELREACPSHKWNELDKIYKTLKGDEEKIREQIQRWWEEPVTTVEPEWEDVNKKNRKTKPGSEPHGRGGGRGGSAPFSGGDRGRGGRGGAPRSGGRSGGVGGRDRGGREGGGRGRGRHGGRGDKYPADTKPEDVVTEIDQNQQEPEAPPAGVPAVGNIRAPQGAWAKKSQPQQQEQEPVPESKPAQPESEAVPVAAGPQAPPPEPAPIAPAPPAPVAPPAPKQPQPPVVAPKKAAPRAAPTAGNVWATKGSAHLIQAEKPKPPAPPAPPAKPAASKDLSEQLTPTLQPASVSIPASTTNGSTVPTTTPAVQPPPSPQIKSTPTPPPSVPEAGVPPTSTASSSQAASNAWKQATAASEQESVTTTEPSPSAPTPSLAEQIGTIGGGTAVVQPPAPVQPPQVEKSVNEAVPPAPAPVAPKPATTRPKTTNNVLNMGHWETGDDDTNLDFGFGSFGNAADEVIETPSGPSSAGIASSSMPAAPSASNEPVAPDANSAASAAAAASPARPPPGLSIGGMPPMPANAVLVHELEDKLEGASLTQKSVASGTSMSSQQEKPQPPPPPQIASALHPQAPLQAVPTSGSEQPSVAGVGAVNPVSHTPATGLPQHQTYNQYGMGMYNYNAAGNGFMAPGPLAGGMIGQPQQHQPLPGQKMDSASAGSGVGAGSSIPTQPPSVGGPSGLYGNTGQSAPSSGNAPTSTSATTTGADNSQAAAAAAAGGMPPGMPNMAYANPALYYGQQPFHMGHQQGGIGYNYGYGAQFGGVQGGFGYPQAMGQSGYGHSPHYDDQGVHSGGHGGSGVGGYQKNTGRYGGRNSHHNNNQYQNQYNPQQHGGYGGQPYGMGYHTGDHFGQRGGYGGMQDPYGMQQQQQQQQQAGQPPQQHQGGGFQDDKGKKGGRGGLGQFQQQQGMPPQLGGAGQQPFGLHGQSNTTQQTGGTGGWSNQQGGTGGWSGGPSWQGK